MQGIGPLFISSLFFSSFIIFNCCLRWLFKKDHPLLSGRGKEDTGSLFIVTSLGVTSLPLVNVENKRRLLLDISFLYIECFVTILNILHVVSRNFDMLIVHN